jgi:AraC-like DNA-binding protein
MFAHMPIIRDILLGAEKQRADLKEMCDVLEINPSDLYYSDIQVPFEKAYRTWEVAVAQTHDQHLGLHLGEQTNISVMGLVGHLMQSCPNLEEAFKAVCNFSVLATDMFTYSISTTGDKTTLSFQPCTPWVMISPDTARHAVEQAMAGTLNVFRILSGKKIFPEQVLLSYSKQKNVAEYERIFQTSIKWKATTNSLVFNRNLLTTPVVSYDESLMGVFCDLVKKRFLELDKDTFVDKVKREVMTTFMGQIPSIESIAARFNITVRSFQRKLEEENTSYRKLCHELGKDFAATLLSDKKVKIIEVASTLGYSDAHAFQRAFKSWTGQTPSKFRDFR